MSSYDQTALGDHNSDIAASRGSRSTDPGADHYRSQVLTSPPSSGSTGTEGSSYATTLVEGETSNGSLVGSSSELSSLFARASSFTHHVDSSDDEILRGSSEEGGDEDWSSADEREFSMAPDTSDDDQGSFLRPLSPIAVQKRSIGGTESVQASTLPLAHGLQPTIVVEESDEEEDGDDDGIFARLMARTAQLRDKAGSPNNDPPAATASCPVDGGQYAVPEIAPAVNDRHAEPVTSPEHQARR